METRLLSIPLNKLFPSGLNVRRTGRELGVEALAASIRAHGLLQNLTVRPAAGRSGGAYEVIAGGRRLAALKTLAKANTIAKDAGVDCLVVEEGSAREVSLAENVVRENLHPADQFEAFRRLHDDEGQACEDIAARFGVTAALVRQRLRLSSVSPTLIEAYRAGDMTLDQLMAFTITDDHARQIAVWQGLTWNKDASAIRRALAEGRVRATDRRAAFVGAEAYEAAGGVIERDLFADDHGGYFTDPALLDRLVLDKLAEVAEAVRQDGWRWVTVALDVPSHAPLRRLYPTAQPLSQADEALLAERQLDYEVLVAEHEGDDEIAEAVSDRLDALLAEIETLQARRFVYDPATIARCGAFVGLGFDGKVKVEPGFVRPEDDPENEPAPNEGEADEAAEGHAPMAMTADAGPCASAIEAAHGLSDRLIADLTAHRTAALQDRLAENPDIALMAMIHALALDVFYVGYDLGTCLDLKVASPHLAAHAPAIREAQASGAIEARHAAWAARLPGASTDLWAFVAGLDLEDRLRLLAHCASRAVNAVRAFERRPCALAHADQLAVAVRLDMAAYWKPTAAGYFSQLTKAQILDAVRETVSDEAARRIEAFKKADMAEAAEQLLADTAWVPAVLRTPGAAASTQTTGVA